MDKIRCKYTAGFIPSSMMGPSRSMVVSYRGLPHPNCYHLDCIYYLCEEDHNRDPLDLWARSGNFPQFQKTSRTMRAREAFPCRVLPLFLRTCVSCSNAVVTLHCRSLQQSPTRCSSEYEVQRNRINYYYLFICYRENLVRQRYDRTRLVESTSPPNNGPILRVEGRG